MTTDRVIAAVVIIFTAAYCYGASQIPLLSFGDPIGPRLFPYIIGGFLLLGALLLLYEGRAAPGSATNSDSRPPAEQASGDDLESANEDMRRVSLLITGVSVWTFLYILGFERLGYVLSTTIFLFGLTYFFHPRRWLVNSAISLLLPPATYLAFHHLLSVSLPRGLLPF